MDWINFDSENFDPSVYITNWKEESDPLKNGIASFLSEWYDDNEFISIQSSGTTGEIQSFDISKSCLLASAQMTASFFSFKKGDTALLCLSMNFIAGKMMVVRSIASQLKLAIGTMGSTPLIELNTRIDFCPMVPLQVENSLEHIHKINTLLIGGAGLNESLEKVIANKHQNAFMSFGMAETLSHIAIRKLGDHSRVFKLMDHVEISTKDDCLLINAPELGVESLQTKDLIELVGEDSFRWVGRKDNLINSGGVKIIPEILEDQIKNIFPENDYFIGAIPDDSLGQKVVLIIEGELVGDGAKIVDRKVFESVGLSRYQIPKEIIHLQEFIRTESNKLKRKYILNHLNELIIISRRVL